MSEFNLNDIPEPFYFMPGQRVADPLTFLDTQIQGIKATLHAPKFAVNCVERLKDFKAAVELAKH